MSSYDKYFSEKNKTHMFALVKDIIIKETAYDISKDPHYHNMFQAHYPQLFKDTQGDTIVDCNRNLIDTLCPLMITEIHKGRKKLSPIPEEPLTPKQTPTPPQTPPSTHKVHIYSSQRTSQSQNRYDYSVDFPEDGDMSCSRITLPEEELPLFGLPTIMIKITSAKHTYTMLCELEETKYLGDRNYISYTPESRVTIPIDPVEKTVCIHILDATGNPCLHGKDIYECVSLKHIQIEGQLFTCLKVMDQRDIRQFQKKDTMTLFQNHIPVGNLTLLQSMGDYLLCKQNTSLNVTGHFQILNLSLQNHLQFHSVPRYVNPR
tara:strand:+ start:1956 stop:2912 length:957 start_codon:yes stop_codon:yes gene_type:complete